MIRRAGSVRLAHRCTPVFLTAPKPKSSRWEFVRFHNSRALTGALQGGFFLIKSHLAVAGLRIAKVEPLYSRGNLKIVGRELHVAA